MDNNFFSFLVKAVLDNQSFPEISRKIKDFEKKVPDITFGAKINEKDIEALRHRVSAIQKELNNDDLTTKERSKLLTELNQKQKILNATERAYRQQSNSDFLQQKNTLSQVSKAQKDILSLKKSQNQLSKLENAETEKINKNLTAQKTLLASMKNWRSKQSDASMKKESYFDIDTDNVVTAESAYSQLFSQLSNGTISVDECRQKFKLLKDELGQFSSAGKIERNILKGINDSSYEKQMATAVASANKWTSENQRVKASISELKTAYKDLIDPQQADQRVKNEERFQQALKKTQNLTSIQKGKYATDDKIASLANKYQTFYDQNTAAHKKWGAQLLKNINELSSGMKIPIDRANQLEKELQDIGNAARQAGKLGYSSFDKIKNIWDKFGGWTLGTQSMMFFVNEIRKAVKELKQVDTLLTEISKANDKLSKNELKGIGNRSFETASKYGKKSTDYLSGVQEASRAGYSDAEDIAELSVAVQGAGDVTAEIANQYVIATDKAYGLQGNVQKLTEVFDGSNKITNLNAVNMTKLAEGMSIVGSTAASFGVDVNETTAALGTMAAVTQQEGSEVARAFRAILLNIRQVSDEEEGISVEGLTKYEKACNALNVKLKETKNGVTSLRDPMEVLNELSVEYSKLNNNDIRRTNLLNSVGGKLRATQLDALLRNWDMYEKMLGEYANGGGSMAVEAEKSANNLEGSLNSLGNTWTDLISLFAQSDTLIGAVQDLNSALSVLKNILAPIGGLLNNVLTVGDGFVPKVALISASIKGLSKLNLAKKLTSFVGRDKMLSLIICPPHGDGNIERVYNEDGFINKTVCSKRLKWCA